MLQSAYGKIACSLVSLLVTTTSASAVVVADSVNDFSSVQGLNNWYYGYVDIVSSPAFVQLPNYYADYQIWAIDRPASSGARYFTCLGADRGHTNGLVTSGLKSREHWAVRRWISTVNDLVTIEGMMGDYTPAFGVGSDGVIAEIRVDGSLAWSRETFGTTPDQPYSLNTTLNIGSIVEFITKPKISDYADQTTFTATITTVPEPVTLALLLAGCSLAIRRKRPAM